MRFSDWHERLEKFLVTVRLKPFTWGEHDCALFACNCVEVITGQDPAVDFRGKYSDKDGAYDALRRYAAGGLVETIEKITTAMKFPEVPVAFAQRGDVVLLDQDGPTMGIVDFTGSNVMVAAEIGVHYHSLTVAQRAWRVE